VGALRLRVSRAVLRNSAQLSHSRLAPPHYRYLKSERNARDCRVVKALIDGNAERAAAIAAEPVGAIADASDASQPKAPRLAVEGVESDAAGDADAAAAPSDGAASSAVATLPPTKRGGGRRASGAQKARTTDAATAPPITPKSVSEVRLLVQSLTTARAELRADGGMRVWRRAAALYLEGVTTAHLGGAPPADLRDAKTSGELIKAALQAAHKGAQAVRRERELADGEAAAGDLLAELLAAADDGADGGADEKPAKRKREGVGKCTSNKSLRDAGKDVVRGTGGQEPRVLKLSELKLDPLPAALTSVVLEAYVKGCGIDWRALTSQKKTDLAGALVEHFEANGIVEAKWSAEARARQGAVVKHA